MAKVYEQRERCTGKVKQGHSGSDNHANISLYLESTQSGWNRVDMTRLCIPGISGCYCKRDWEESRPKMERSKLTTAGDKLKMVRPQTTAREWTIQKEKSSQSWKISGRQTGLGDSVDIRMGEMSQVSTPELLALQQHWNSIYRKGKGWKEKTWCIFCKLN